MAKASAGPVSFATICQLRLNRLSLFTLIALAAGCTFAPQGDDRAATGSPPARESTDDVLDASMPVLAIGERGTFGGIAITPLAVLEDSRCPEGVDCAWPGQVVLRIAVERDGQRSEHQLVDYHGPLQVGAANIDIDRVEPQRTMANRDVAAAQYGFSFTVTGVNP
jgi:hypothetical protein